jgi:hypothetical protein
MTRFYACHISIDGTENFMWHVTKMSPTMLCDWALFCFCEVPRFGQKVAAVEQKCLLVRIQTKPRCTNKAFLKSDHTARCCS